MQEKIKGGLYQRNRTIEMFRENRSRTSLRMWLLKISQFIFVQFIVIVSAGDKLPPIGKSPVKGKAGGKVSAKDKGPPAKGPRGRR